jgi:hypothetical protein
MVNIGNNKNDGRTLLSDSANICAVDWWSRYDIENHVGRRISDDEWEKISNLLEDNMKADMELLDFCITQSGVK